MNDDKAEVIAAARQRVAVAQEKYDRQQKRYAMQAIENEGKRISEKTQAAKTLMAELEAELAASRAALHALEAETPGG